MPEEPNVYSVSDLAAALQLPRTTINDWLKIYASYLDTEMRGKRRVYTANACAILREIAELRAAGRSNYEVEQELARRHGIRPEPAPPEPETVNEVAPTTSQLPIRQEPALPAVPNFTEIRVHLEELEQKRKRFTLRLLAVLLVFVALLALLAVFGIARLRGALEQADARHKANLRTQAEAFASARENADIERKKEVADALSKAQAAHREELEKLQLQQKEQREELREFLKNLAKDERSAAEKQWIEQKEAFARRQQDLLRELEEIRKNGQKEWQETRKNTEKELEATRVNAEKKNALLLADAAELRKNAEAQRKAMQALLEEIAALKAAAAQRPAEPKQDASSIQPQE